MLMVFALVHTLILSARTLCRNPLNGQMRDKLSWGWALLYILAFSGCGVTIVFVDMPAMRKQEANIQVEREKIEREKAELRAKYTRMTTSRSINTPPPSPIRGKFTIQLSSGWDESPYHGDAATYSAMHKSEKHWLMVKYFEGGFGDDAASRMADGMIANIKSSKNGAILGGKETVEIDGRNWLRFAVEMNDSGSRKKECFYLYSGAEGTFCINTVSPVDVSKKDAGQIEEMALTFKFVNSALDSGAANKGQP
jgi:hypothetical protein